MQAFMSLEFLQNQQYGWTILVSPNPVNSWQVTISDEHSCSCSHKRDNIASSDQAQFHSHGNGYLSEWLVECSCSVVEASWVAVALAVVASVVEQAVVAIPFEVLQRQGMLVADGRVVVAEVAVGIELAFEQVQLDVAVRTFSEQLQKTQIQTKTLLRPHRYLLHYAILSLFYRYIGCNR